MKKYVVCLSLAMLFGMGGPACASAAMRGEYTVVNDRVGINAYVYGKRTVLEFVESPSSLVVTDDKGLPVAYERIGERFYRLARNLDKFSAVINGDLVAFEFNRPDRPLAVTAPPVVAAKPITSAPGAATAPAAIVASASTATTTAAPVAVAPALAPATATATPSAPQATVLAPLAAAALVAPAVVDPAQRPAAIQTPSGLIIPAVQVTGPVSRPAFVPPKAIIVETWDVEATDLSIYAALKRWTRKTEGRGAQTWQISWEIPVDYPVTILGTFRMPYEEAVAKLIDGYRKADYPPKACIYNNHVIRIVRFLGTGTECD